jgi:hypothetical protein
MIYHKYKVFCETDNKWEYVILEDGSPAPTTCPTNTAHTITISTLSIVETIDTDSKLVDLNVPKTTTGLQKMSVYEPEGGAATIVSINFADRCSWYVGAVQVLLGSMINTGLVYSDPNSKTHFIDLEHGRLYDEDNVMLASGNSYKVKVYVDAVEVTTGFSINYPAGTITFDSTPSGVVTASYWYADKSYYRVRPKVGKVLAIKVAEVQFSQGTTLDTSGGFKFAPWFVDHPVYGTMEIPGQQIIYKNFKDFISACNEGQGLIPKIGELTQDIHIFPFNYARPKPIKYTDYIEIRVYCVNHLAVGGGEFATATFYVTIDDIV